MPLVGKKRHGNNFGPTLFFIFAVYNPLVIISDDQPKFECQP